MKKKLFALVLAATLTLTGCGYKKPETHSMMGLNIKSITTVCGTDCTMKDIDTSSTGTYAMTTYVYTDVADDKGVTDAKKYHAYLSSLKSCVKIDDFDEKKGSYSARFKVSDNINEGFLMKISFTKDSYSVHIEDNASLK